MTAADWHGLFAGAATVAAVFTGTALAAIAIWVGCCSAVRRRDRRRAGQQ